MNYDKIINATYNWITAKQVAWFLVFFWLSVGVLLIVPWAVEKQFFASEINPFIIFLYDLIYIAIIVGFIALTQNCLKVKNLNAEPLSFRRFVNTFALVFVELWFIFVWNLHKSYRITQLLLLVGIPLLVLYSAFNNSIIIFYSLILFVILYLFMVAYNCIRLFFSVTIFYNKKLSVVESVKESWGLTHKRFNKIFIGLILIFGALFVLLIIISIILGAISNLLLLSYFTPPVAYSLAVRIAFLFAIAPVLVGYYFGVIELYSQLNKHHDTEHRIKRILAKKITHPVIIRPVKKKIIKKKKVSKKVKKKSKKHNRA